MQVLNCDGPRLTLSVSGSVAPLLRVAAELDPVDMTARRADLDELFLAYYRSAEPEEAIHAT